MRRKADKLSCVKAPTEDLAEAVKLASRCTLECVRRASEADTPEISEAQTRALKNMVSTLKEMTALLKSVYKIPEEAVAGSTNSVTFVSGEEYSQ